MLGNLCCLLVFEMLRKFIVIPFEKVIIPSLASKLDVVNEEVYW